MSLYDYDFIFIHWTANDDNIHKFYGGDIKKVKTVFETLVRTALALPKAPAVIIFELTKFGKSSQRVCIAFGVISSGL